MKIENPLDKHLEINKRMLPGLREATTDVAAVLHLAWLTTQSVFEDRASPELAIPVFEALLERWQRHESLLMAPQEQS